MQRVWDHAFPRSESNGSIAQTLSLAATTAAESQLVNRPFFCPPEEVFFYSLVTSLSDRLESRAKALGPCFSTFRIQWKHCRDPISGINLNPKCITLTLSITEITKIGFAIFYLKIKGIRTKPFL